MTGVSIAGGIAHNVGQILIAMLIVHNVMMVYYLPFLLISGVLTGFAIGMVGSLIIGNLKKYHVMQGKGR